MCYFADYNGIEIIFEKGDIFTQKKQILVKDPRNCSDCNDRRLPRIIPLNELKMDEKDLTEIKRNVERNKTKKINSRLKRKRLPQK